MKFNLRQTISTFGGALAITAVLSNAAYAIERTCSGAYEVEYKTPSGQAGKLVFGGFESTRSCGRLVPNRCRDRARKALIKCMEKHYFENTSAIPFLSNTGEYFGRIWYFRDVSDRQRKEEALRLILEGTSTQVGSEFLNSCVRSLATILRMRYALIAGFFP